MPVPSDLEPDQLAAWRFDCERFGRELPRPVRFRDAPRGEREPGQKLGPLIDPTRPAIIAVYPDGTFPVVAMPPIFGTVCGSFMPPDPGRVYPITEVKPTPDDELAAAIKARYDNRVVTNGRQLTAKQQELQDAALELWLDSRIGRALEARLLNQTGIFDPVTEWDALQEATREPFLKQARKQLKPAAPGHD